MNNKMISFTPPRVEKEKQPAQPISKTEKKMLQLDEENVENRNSFNRP